MISRARFAVDSARFIINRVAPAVAIAEGMHLGDHEHGERRPDRGVAGGGNHLIALVEGALDQLRREKYVSPNRLAFCFHSPGALLARATSTLRFQAMS